MIPAPSSPATPESVWAILQETAQMQKVFAAEYEAQRKKDAAEAEVRKKELDAYMQRTSEEIRELNKTVNATAASVHELNKQVNTTSASVHELNKQVNTTSASVHELSKEVGGIAHNNGYLAEEYFQNALEASLSFANIQYDFMIKNKHFYSKQAEAEFDILLFNGTSVAIIETKYRVHQNDLLPLITKKVQHFRTFFPMYAQHKIYLGIASMSFNDEVISEAKQLGIGVLKQKGDTIECDTDNIKAY